MAASSGVATSSQQETLDSALDDLLLLLEEEGDADNLEGTTDKDVQDAEGDDVPSEEDVKVDTPETDIEDNSSQVAALGQDKCLAQ